MRNRIVPVALIVVTALGAAACDDTETPEVGQLQSEETEQMTEEMTEDMSKSEHMSEEDMTEDMTEGDG